MIHVPIEGSSNILSTAHEGNVMQVTFKHGGTYEYPLVDAYTHSQLRTAESAGKFLNSLGIKGIKLQDVTS
jgi:hypothetical protein